MTAERVERLKARLNEVIATAGAASALVVRGVFRWENVDWDVPDVVSDHLDIWSPSLAVSLARADLALVEEHVEKGYSERRNRRGWCKSYIHGHAPSWPCDFILSRCSAWGIE